MAMTPPSSSPPIIQLQYALPHSRREVDLALIIPSPDVGFDPRWLSQAMFAAAIHREHPGAASQGGGARAHGPAAAGHHDQRRHVRPHRGAAAETRSLRGGSGSDPSHEAGEGALLACSAVVTMRTQNLLWFQAHCFFLQPRGICLAKTLRSEGGSWTKRYGSAWF